MFNAFLHMVTALLWREADIKEYIPRPHVYFILESAKSGLFTLIYSMRGTVLEPVHKTDWLFAAALPECIGAKVASCRGLALTLRLPGIP